VLIVHRRSFDAVVTQEPLVASYPHIIVAPGATRRDECRVFGETEALRARWALPGDGPDDVRAGIQPTPGKFGA